jgi:hypothetical protein
MMRLRLSLIGALVLLGPGLARAQNPAPAAQAATPVRAGKTTVTVIDESESVDDIVTRVRAERARQGKPGDDGARTDSATAGARERVREKIREARPKVREKIRERLSERKAAKASRLEKRIERLRSR